MSGNTCKTCTYFLQHYGLKQQQLFRVSCGHCTYARAKGKHPDSASCEHYSPGVPDESAFVTKQYLSKELLQYLLSLELLPEITETDGAIL